MIGILQASALLGLLITGNGFRLPTSLLRRANTHGEAYLFIRAGLFVTGNEMHASRRFATISGSACAYYWVFCWSC